MTIDPKNFPSLLIEENEGIFKVSIKEEDGSITPTPISNLIPNQTETLLADITLLQQMLNEEQADHERINQFVPIHTT